MGARLDDTCQFELHHDDVHQHGDRRAACIDHVVGRFPVERVARIVQFAQPAQRVSDLQQGPLDVVAQAPEQVLGGRAQVDHVEVIAQLGAVGLPQHRAASGRQHALGIGGQVGDHGLFEIPKGYFTFALEVIADRAAYALLDHMIGVDERKVQPHPQAPAHCGFSGAGQADECDRHAVAATPARQRAALRSVIIFGVIKTSISVLLATRSRLRNSAPR